MIDKHHPDWQIKEKRRYELVRRCLDGYERLIEEQGDEMPKNILDKFLSIREYLFAERQYLIEQIKEKRL